MSAVVLAELYAGADERDTAAIDQLRRDFERVRRVLVPTLNDWVIAGRMLAKLGQDRGYENVGRSRMVHDALIAASAARMGITIITANEKDFWMLSKYCSLRWMSLSEWNKAE